MIDSDARYAILEQIPGYTLKVPLGIIIIHDLEDEINEAYTALHYFPTQDDKGLSLGAVSRREEEACEGLAQKISDFYTHCARKQSFPSVSECKRCTLTVSFLPFRGRINNNEHGLSRN